MSQANAPMISIAGQPVHAPFGRLASYALNHERTVLQYDLGTSVPTNQITTAEISRTRAVSSRVSDQEGQQLIHTCNQVALILAGIPPAAHIRDAGPAVHGGLFDQALAVFNQLLAPGIRYAKVSKILHLKRPHLFPILDSHLTKAYRKTATQAVLHFQTQRPGYRRLYWAAIRGDVIAGSNVLSLAVLRGLIQQDVDARVRRLASLSDLRLFDILTW